MEQFIEASRKKIMFDTRKGFLSVEDLWDLPLDRGQVTLDQIAIGLHKELEAGTESFVNKAKPHNAELKLKLDIVVYIIETLIKERDEAKQAKLRSEKKQQILEIIARKESKDLEEKSLDELKGLLENL